MRPRKSHDSRDDPSKDPDILGWFDAPDPPPTGQAAPNLRAHVRGRIAERRARRSMFAWLPSLGPLAWGPALAMLLVLSVGLNVWWGLQRVGLKAPGFLQLAQTPLGDLGPVGPLHTYRFQAEMSQVQALGSVVAARAPRQEPAAVVGFTPQATRTTFFRMGTLFAGALAALRSGELEGAARRLDFLMHALATVQAPRTLAQYLSEIKTLARSRQHEDAMVARFLALFEPLYEEAYTGTDRAEGVILFRAGAWMENMYLAAASGDALAVRRGGLAVDEVRNALARMNAPQRALRALDRLRPLVTRQPITEHELIEVRALAQEIQTLLST